MIANNDRTKENVAIEYNYRIKIVRISTTDNRTLATNGELF